MNIDGMLRSAEGRKYKAYRDTMGVCTIGEGHTGPEVHDGLVWDDAQIDFAKQLDVNAAWQACADHLRPWFAELNDARQAVFVSMFFQLGAAGALKFTTTLAHAARGDFAGAASGMRNSLWGHQTPIRVNKLATQLETGEWQSWL